MQNLKVKVLFLYTELAEYVVSCLRHLAENNAEVHVVHWPINKEAPFEFSNASGVNFYEREKHDYDSLKLLTENIDPDIIVCSGWLDKLYLKICAHFFSETKTVLTLDNQWNGGVKQQVARLISPFYLKTKFSNAWVPGERQVKYAQKLGFSSSKITTGFYCANVAYFNTIYENNKTSKEQRFPKRLLYVGRYIESKGIFNLWNAFVELVEEGFEDWELWCFGTGDEYENRVLHSNIKHHGFTQPNELQNYLNDVGVFVLPSEFEPWGVVVHEMAAAGFPLIASSNVGAADKFLKNEVNGYVYQANQDDALKKVLRKIMSKTPDELVKMGENSNQLALELTPQKWVNNILSIN